MKTRRKKKRAVSFAKYLIRSAIIFFCVVIVAVDVFVSHQYSKTMWDRYLDKTQTSMLVAANQIVQVMNNTKIAAAVTWADRDIDDYLYGVYSTQEEEILARYMALNCIMDGVKENPYLQGLFFIKDDNSLFGYNAMRSYLPELGTPEELPQEIIDKIVCSKTPMWSAPYQLSDFSGDVRAEASMEDVLIIGAVEEQYSVSYNDQLGTLMKLAVVDAKYILSCFDYLCDEGESAYFVNEKGECILSVGDEWREGVVDCWPCVDMEASGGYVHWMDPEGEPIDVVYQKIRPINWYLIKTSSAREFQKDLAILQGNTMLVVGILLTAAIVFYALWSRRLTHATITMSNAMQQMRKGDLSIRIEEPIEIQEYETIRKQFNMMADSIERLMAETKQMEREHVTLEARALQTQLSPHMIFNSISAIRWMATALGVEKISEMLGALAELLRPVFREWRLKWTLREEMNHLKNYIFLLRLRYGNTMKMDIDIPEDLMKAEIPCFVLQPILENCFEHSTRKNAKLQVKIQAEQVTPQWIRVTVRDNGGGIDPEVLEEIRNCLDGRSDENQGRRGIGLYNVHRKIQLLDGSDSGLNIESKEGIGTTVTLNIRPNSEK